MPQNPASQVQAVLGAFAGWSKTPCPKDAFLSAGNEPTNRTLTDITANLQARFHCLQPPAMQTDATDPRRFLQHAAAGKPTSPTNKPAAPQPRDHDCNTRLLDLYLCRHSTLTWASPTQATQLAMPVTLTFTQAGVTAGKRTLPRRLPPLTTTAGGIPAQANGAHITTTWLIN